jgi:hypothetical protein
VHVLSGMVHMSNHRILGFVAVVVGIVSVILLLSDPPKIDKSDLLPVSVRLMSSPEPVRVAFSAGWSEQYFVNLIYCSAGRHDGKNAPANPWPVTVHWKVVSGDSTIVCDSREVHLMAGRISGSRLATFRAIRNKRYEIELLLDSARELVETDTLKLEAGVAAAGPSVGIALMDDLGRFAQAIEGWSCLAISLGIGVLSIRMRRTSSGPPGVRS